MEKARLEGHEGDVNCVTLWEGHAWDGSTVGSTVGMVIASGSDDKTVRYDEYGWLDGCHQGLGHNHTYAC